MEKFVAVIVMVFGVCFFSFAIGSLSTVVGRMDARESTLKEKMAVFEEFSREAALNKDLKYRLRHAL
jgi:hypothetical protein